MYIATLCRLFLGYGLKYRIEALAADAHDTLGVSFDARHGLVTKKPLRMWRLRGAIYELCEQGECSGDVLRVIVGHTVHACMLARHALCILSSCYKFMVDYEDDVEPLPSDVLAELYTMAALLPTFAANLFRKPLDHIYCSDACTKGYAAHRTKFEHSELDLLSQVREKWRFKPARPSVPRQLGTQSAMFAGERGSFDAVMDTLASPLERLQVEETLIRRRVAKVLAAERAIDPHGDEAHLGSQDPGSLFGPDSVPRISDKLMDPGRWSRVVVGGFRTTGPIHMLEAWTSHLTLLYAAAEPDSVGKFVVSIGDNMSELLASEAGRASDLALNTIMRKNAAVVFA